MKNKQAKTLVLVGAKVPIEVKSAMEKIAEEEERSTSQVVSRLLSTHPALKSRIKKSEHQIA